MSYLTVRHYSQIKTMERILQKIMSKNGLSQLETTGIELQPADKESIFIHCTFHDQTMDKIHKFYPQQTVYVADLSIEELEKAGFSLIIEANPGGQNTYPHLYHTSGIAHPIPRVAIKQLTKIKGDP